MLGVSTGLGFLAELEAPRSMLGKVWYVDGAGLLERSWKLGGFGGESWVCRWARLFGGAGSSAVRVGLFYSAAL